MRAYIYEASDFFRVPFRRFVWATRHENGEQFGREHYHWLIGGEDWKPSLSNMFQLNALWDGFPKAGFARHYVYDSAKHGIGYITKCLSSSSAFSSRVGAQIYEVGKFNWSEVTLSDALLRMVGGRRKPSHERVWRSSVRKKVSRVPLLNGEWGDRSRFWAERL